MKTIIIIIILCKLIHFESKMSFSILYSILVIYIYENVKLLNILFEHCVRFLITVLINTDKKSQVINMNN